MTRKFLTKIVSHGTVYTENYRYRLDDYIIYRAPIRGGKLITSMEEPWYIYDFDYNEWRSYK